jgi:hypothetical protein
MIQIKNEPKKLAREKLKKSMALPESKLEKA